MQRYRSYKDSGVQWLGQIPSHWSINRLASYFTERKTKVSDKDFAPLSVTKMGILPQLENVAKTDDGDNRKLVKVNDFVINSRSDRRGSSGVSPMDGSVSLINIVLSPRPDINPSFCNYLLRSYAFIEEFYRNGHGIVADLWTTRYDEMKMIKICIPPYEEQEAIVAYLDAATAKIDEAIAQQQRMIDLLNERKELLIENVVTKGIKNGTWKTRRLRHVCKFRNGYTPSKNVTAYWENGTIPWFRMEDIHLYGRKLSQSEQYITPSAVKGDGLFKAGSFILATSATVGEHALLLVDALSNQRFTNLALFEELSNELSTEYFFYFLYHIDRECRGFTNGSTFASVSNQDLKNILVGIPSPEEQRRIVSMLDTETFKIDNALELVSQQIQFFQERKQIIINDVVTGKVRIV